MPYKAPSGCSLFGRIEQALISVSPQLVRFKLALRGAPLVFQSTSTPARARRFERRGRRGMVRSRSSVSGGSGGGAAAKGIPPWSQAEEDRKISSLIESVWEGWEGAIAPVSVVGGGVAGASILAVFGWSALHPVAAVVATLAVALCLYMVYPIFLPCPSPPPPHGPLASVSRQRFGDCHVKVSACRRPLFLSMPDCNPDALEPCRNLTSSVFATHKTLTLQSDGIFSRAACVTRVK